jgi:hypothetical protein
VRYYGPLIDGGGSSNQREDRTPPKKVTVTTKKEPEFTGPEKYSPFVPTEPVKAKLPIVSPYKPSTSNGLFVGPIPVGTVRTETGYVPEVTSSYSPGDFRKAEEKSNEPFYASQQDFGSVSLVSNNFIPAITPTPLTPSAVSATIATPPPPPVKTATLDIILFDDEATTVDTMADLIFENIGGQELINISRSDIINGQKISYQPIKNLSSIQQRYNPNNILSLQQTADKYFAGFSIKLEDKIPNEGNGINGENVYIEENTGDLIIEFININNDEQIEVQITADGTIYEADLGEINS